MTEAANISQSPKRNMRIYLDQNILGHIREGTMSLKELKQIEWIYSSEHFNEIARGNDLTFLNILRDLNARQIELADPFQITDLAILREDCPLNRYREHLAAINEVPFDQSLFTDVLLRTFGANNLEDVRAWPKRLTTQIELLLGSSDEARERISATSKLLKPVAEALAEAKGHLYVREALGTHGGRVGDFDPSTAIVDIWHSLRPVPSNVSIDQFFGFERIDAPGIPLPTFLGIIGCHCVLNLIGYKADGKLGKIPNLRRTLSDATHIAYAAFCDCVLTADKNFRYKAKAIYSYRNIGTRVLFLQVDTRRKPEDDREAIHVS